MIQADAILPSRSSSLVVFLFVCLFLPLNPLPALMVLDDVDWLESLPTFRVAQREVSVYVASTSSKRNRRSVITIHHHDTYYLQLSPPTQLTGSLISGVSSPQNMTLSTHRQTL